jgi:hypothetical protein
VLVSRWTTSNSYGASSNQNNCDGVRVTIAVAEVLTGRIFPILTARISTEKQQIRSNYSYTECSEYLMTAQRRTQEK